MRVIIVLGYRLNDDGTPHKILISRCAAAAEAYKAGGFDYVLLSGGTANKVTSKSEAEVMKGLLLTSGVSEAALLTETCSKTTLQNGKFCKPIIKSLNPESVLLCTSRTHFERKYLNPYRIFKRALRIPILKLSVE